MKRLALVVALVTLSVPAAAQQTQQQSQGKPAQTDARVAKREGSDCSPQRAGVRCSRPKAKKVWFWGK